MARPEQIEGQRDFSLGEVDVWVKRRDDLSVVKSAARQMQNFRILNSGAVENRPGRDALFLERGRVEEVLMSPGQVFYLVFGANYLRVYNAAGTRVASTTYLADGSTPIPWTAATAKNVVYTIYQLSIYITYADGAPANVPQVLTWDGVSQNSTWTLTTFAEYLLGSQKRTWFYRISTAGVTLQPSATTGNITLTASAPVFQPGHVGTRLRWVGRQILITGYTSSTVVSGTVEETLPNTETLTWAGTGVDAKFSLGDVVIGSSSNAEGIVVAVTTSTITVIILNGIDFIWTGVVGTTDVPVGPGGNAGGIASVTVVSPLATEVWDDEVMNAFRGYPSSCFFDQARLGFCNFPAVPSGIGWSAVADVTDLYVDFSSAAPDNAIFEIAPGKSQVYFVVAGMESSEFVFCDNAVYYIPITVQSPLAPGSVGFTQLTASGCAAVQPRAAEQTIIFIDQSTLKIRAVQAPGAYYRPYVIDDLSEMHTHLFATGPIAIAIPLASTVFEERYIYVPLANGNYVVGKYQMRNGLIEPGPEGKPHIGWAPASGAGIVTWIAARASNVVFTTSYPAASLVELLNQTRVLDATVFVNAAPAPLAPPGGVLTGPLWFWAGSTVSLWDNGRPLDTYQVDIHGKLIPQFIDGENLTSATLQAGQPWTATLEPWVPQAPPSTGGARQRMLPRKIKLTAVSVENSTGFVLQRLQSDPTTALNQPFGTPLSQVRFPYYNQDEDPTQPAPLREMTYRKRWLGRSYDPRIALVKDQPGPLRIIEFGQEVTL